ncbi:MAG TPA: methyl-accepting chemotaxis protein, partial [Clostridia bacterium]|nr:methyl-accepting chemotaxis protein [Clostridia bacterium]
MRSLRQKLLVQFVIIILIAVMAVTFINYVQAKTIAEGIIQVESQKYAESKANEIDYWLAARVAEIEAYSQIPDIKTMDWNKQEGFLKSEAKRLSDIYEILFTTDTEGNFNTTRDAVGNIGHRDYIQEALTGKTVISDPVVSASTGSVIINVATPIRNDSGQIIGIMAGSILMDTINDIVAGVSLGESGYGYMINKQGLVLAGPREEDILNRNILEEDNESLKQAGQRMVNGEKGYSIYELDGTERYVAFAPVASTGWALAVAVPYEELTKSVGQLLRSAVLVGIITLVVAAGIIWFVASTIVKPITGLSKITEVVAAGDLTQEAQVASKDEVGQLAQNFNKMVVNLRSLVNRIMDIAGTLAASAQQMSVSSEQTGIATQQVAKTISELAQAANEQADAVNKSNQL